MCIVLRVFTPHDLLCFVESKTCCIDFMLLDKTQGGLCSKVTIIFELGVRLVTKPSYPNSVLLLFEVVVDSFKVHVKVRLRFESA